MQVESFECTETASEPLEASEEAIALIEKLGLKGQHKLVTKDTASGRDTRCPYRQIRADEDFVYRAICPQCDRLEDYTSSPIPLRVLQIAAHAKDLGIFKELRVWSQADSTIKDPVLVGVTPDPSGYTWSNGPTFILARWGDELETFSTLAKKAFDIVRDNLKASASRMVNVVNNISDAELVQVGPTAKAVIG